MFSVSITLDIEPFSVESQKDIKMKLLGSMDSEETALWVSLVVTVRLTRDPVTIQLNFWRLHLKLLIDPCR